MSFDIRFGCVTYSACCHRAPSFTVGRMCTKMRTWGAESGVTYERDHSHVIRHKVAFMTVASESGASVLLEDRCSFVITRKVTFPSTSDMFSRRFLPRPRSVSCQSTHLGDGGQCMFRDVPELELDVAAEAGAGVRMRS